MGLGIPSCPSGLLGRLGGSGAFWGAPSFPFGILGWFRNPSLLLWGAGVDQGVPSSSWGCWVGPGVPFMGVMCWGCRQRGRAGSRSWRAWC